MKSISKTTQSTKSTQSTLHLQSKIYNNLKALSLAVVLAFFPFAHSHAQSVESVDEAEFAPYRPISENPRNDGLYVGFYYAGHNQSYQGVKPSLSKKDENYTSFALASAIGVGYYTSFLDKKLREWDNMQGVFHIGFAKGLVDIEKSPFILYLIWSAEMQVIVDKEQKSLCYTPRAIGCVFPYTPYIKNTKAYALPNVDSQALYEIDSKKDIVFPLALTSDKAFYQVIIFPHFMNLTKFKDVEESYDYFQGVRDECSDGWRATHGDGDGICYGEPINAFVPKSAVKKILPSHPLMRLDPQYADVPVFFTPPKSIHKIHLDELESRGKK